MEDSNKDISIISRSQFFGILNTILSTLSIDEMLTIVVEEIRKTIGAERSTLYLINYQTKELFSKVLQAKELVEICLPLDKLSLAGYTAITRKRLNIKNVYNSQELHSIDKELVFDKSWDQKSGYKTESVLVIPIPDKSRDYLLGVFQALNKKGGFTDEDVNVMEQLAYLLGIAVNNALLYHKIEEEKSLREYIIDDIEEGICILDINKNVYSANRFLEMMSGMRLTMNDMIGKDFFELFPNFAETELETKVNEVIAKGYKMNANLTMLNVKIIPYHDINNKISKIILIFERL
ncbi:MAG: GAF domain-containing protein [Thermodesulfovibrionales bacterium]|nr:GAF domain-containing protein [Thermodesulfovibrionales bacterium]